MSEELAHEWPSTLNLNSLETAYSSIDSIREQLFANHLIILRGIGNISVKEFADFASQLGELEQPLANTVVDEMDGRVEVLQRKVNDNHYRHSLSEATTSALRKPSSFYWHADRSFLPQPSFLTATRIVTAPEVGGATDFINTELAYASLAENDAIALRGLVGVHSYAYYHKKLAGDNIYTSEETAKKRALYPPVEHPLVMAHPITRKSLVYTSPLTLERVLGPEEDVLAAENSSVHLLYETKPSYYSHTWTDGDIVIWDNFGVLHRGSASEGERKLQRVTIALPLDTNG
jgi:taurine dioxygenase